MLHILIFVGRRKDGFEDLIIVDRWMDYNDWSFWMKLFVGN